MRRRHEPYADADAVYATPLMLAMPHTRQGERAATPLYAALLQMMLTAPLPVFRCSRACAMIFSLPRLLRRRVAPPDACRCCAP